MNEFRDMLGSLAEEDSLRFLRTGSAYGRCVCFDGRPYVNMSGNDYLGLGSDVGMQREFLQCLVQEEDSFIMSNPSSRLMTGNSPEYGELESSLSAMYAGKSALVLGNGYMVNTGVLPALTSAEDLVLADRYVHASIIDGLRLCGCRWHRFAHNDMEHLESLLKKYRTKHRRVWVVSESVFSMDGDLAPIEELADLRKRYDLNLYLDEAHAFGVFGHNGAGCAANLGLDGEFDVIIATFGKAAASFGAFVALDPVLREVLINRMRTVIFSTALPPVNLRWTKFIVDRMDGFGGRRRHLADMVRTVSSGVSDASEKTAAATHIIPVMAYGDGAAVAMSKKFRDAGFWVMPIRYPTVPKGKARVRISLNAALTDEDIKGFMEAWKNIG